MTTLAIRTLSIAIALGLGAAAAIAAPEPTLSDIAGCNEQAAAKTSVSALPHPGSKPEGVRPDAAPGQRADGGTSGIVPGPADRGVANPQPSARVPMPGTGGPGEKTDPSGSIITSTPDPLVKGMDATKVDDPQYRAAYRDCMRGKLQGR